MTRIILCKDKNFQRYLGLKTLKNRVVFISGWKKRTWVQIKVCDVKSGTEVVFCINNAKDRKI